MKPPSLLFLDIESSGLYKERLSMDDSQQPFAVSIAVALCNPDGDFVNFAKLLIKPDGRSIQTGAENVHGISARDAAQYGVPEARALGLLSDLLKTMPMESYIKCISFGDFDKRVISSLFARFAISQGKQSNAYDRLWMARPLVEFCNLMDPVCTTICKIPSKDVPGSYKFPSLDEAAQTILGQPPREGRHDAFEDMMTTRAIYLRLKERGFFPEREVA
jgi:hypothetical protein